MVPEHRDGAPRDLARDEVEDGARVGPVPDEIAEEGVAPRRPRPRVREARLERLEVRVDVREERDPQRLPSPSHIMNSQVTTTNSGIRTAPLHAM